MGLTPPTSDQFEITILGTGYGECCIAHLGDNQWMIVDSFLDLDDRPVALSYLDAVGVDYDRVVLIVATHWDDDHILGLSAAVESCPNAKVFIAAAMGNEEFAGFAQKASAFGTKRIPSGVSQLMGIVETLKGKAGRRGLAKVDTLLFARKMEATGLGEPVTVSALSPGDGDIDDFLAQIAGYAFSKDVMSVKRTVRFSKNDASVVLLVSFGDRHIVLGADLENRGPADRGWNNVLASQSIKGKIAEVFKVSHHGSSNGHSVAFWNGHLVSEPWAVVAPWRLAGWSLPKESDVDRLMSCTPNLWITALPSGGKPIPRGNIVASELRNHGLKITATYKSVGFVRLRTPIGTTDLWDIHVADPGCSGATYKAHLAAA